MKVEIHKTGETHQPAGSRSWELINVSSRRRNSPDCPRTAERTQFARDQRAGANEFAAAVWQMVRGGRIDGYKFRREYPEPPYTLDFVCLALRLVIEVDGESHFAEQGRVNDRQRDRLLAQRGYRVVRVNGFDVLRDPAEARRQIVDAVHRRAAERPRE